MEERVSELWGDRRSTGVTMMFLWLRLGISAGFFPDLSKVPSAPWVLVCMGEFLRLHNAVDLLRDFQIS